MCITVLILSIYNLGQITRQQPEFLKFQQIFGGNYAVHQRNLISTESQSEMSLSLRKPNF